MGDGESTRHRDVYNVPVLPLLLLAVFGERRRLVEEDLVDAVVGGETEESLLGRDEALYLEVGGEGDGIGVGEEDLGGGREERVREGGS